MTVCVAAIASYLYPNSEVEHPVVIYCADRMITVGDKREYELLDQTKMFPLAPQIRILVSGKLDALLPICRDTHATVQELQLELVAEVAAAFADHFRVHRQHRVERLYFQPYGLTIDDFIARHKELAPEFRERLDDSINNPDDDLGEVIILGIDRQGPHIFTVCDPGVEASCDATGYAAIGIGAEHAEAAFAASLYTIRREWTLAMMTTFFAKKAAEVAPGVGEAADFYYLANEEVYFEPLSNTVEKLDAMYAERQSSENEALERDAQTLAKLLKEENLAQDLGSPDPDPQTSEHNEKQAPGEDVLPEDEKQSDSLD